MDSGWGAVSCAHHDAMRDDSSHMGERDRYGVRFLLSHFVVFFGAHGQARLVLIPSLRIIFKYIPRTCLSYVVFFFFFMTHVFSAIISFHLSCRRVLTQALSVVIILWLHFNDRVSKLAFRLSLFLSPLVHWYVLFCSSRLSQLIWALVRNLHGNSKLMLTFQNYKLIPYFLV